MDEGQRPRVIEDPTIEDFIMKNLASLATTFVLSAFAITVAPQPANAIKCSGITQINKNSRIITPYCEHEHMAKIARTYGIKTTGRRLRNNINHKQRVCEHIGHDTRLSSVCGGLRLEDRGRFPS